MLKEKERIRPKSTPSNRVTLPVHTHRDSKKNRSLRQKESRFFNTSDAASTAGSTIGGLLLGGSFCGVLGAFIGGAVGLVAGLITAAHRDGNGPKHGRGKC